MNLDRLQLIAQRNLTNATTMASSARYCYDTALSFRAQGDADSAARLFLRSVAYSIGILAMDYENAFEAAGFSGPVR